MSPSPTSLSSEEARVLIQRDEGQFLEFKSLWDRSDPGRGVFPCAGAKTSVLMKRFYRLWPTEGILQTPSEESTLAPMAARFPLPWSAYVRLLAVKNEQAREFYQSETLRGGWSVRQLDRQIQSQFYERTALSRDKAAMLEKGVRPQPEDVTSKVMAAEYRTALPDEKLIAAELEQTRRALEERRSATGEAT